MFLFSTILLCLGSFYHRELDTRFGSRTINELRLRIHSYNHGLTFRGIVVMEYMRIWNISGITGHSGHKFQNCVYIFCCKKRRSITKFIKSLCQYIVSRFWRIFAAMVFKSYKRCFGKFEGFWIILCHAVFFAIVETAHEVWRRLYGLSCLVPL